MNFLLTIFLSSVLLNGINANDKKENLGTVIGIDLGTTYSCVGVYKNGRVEIIANSQGNRITPSYVAFEEQTGERLIGDAAKNQLTGNPLNTVFDAKRMIGRKWGDPQIKEDMKYFPFRVREHRGKPHMQVKVKGNDKLFSAEEISGMVLSKMKQTAEDYLGKKVTHAVVTVPAYFTDAQRQATKDAATISGLKVLRIINEPTAAAIAYGLDKKEGEKSILVFDLGGGTFDVSLLTIDNGVFEVIATNGDTHLGGEDFDQRVIEHLMKVYEKKRGVDVRGDVRAVQKLRREAEKAKRALSSEHTTRVEIESFHQGRDFSEVLTRAKFEELNSDLFKSTLKPVTKVLEDAGLDKKDVDEVVLVGGSTRIPKVQKLVQNFFDGKLPNTGINPDEAVAYGAAVQAGVLGGESTATNLVLLDVCPLTLGIETVGGVMSKLISRNSVVPTKKTDMYSTADDNQDVVTISVYEGERALVKDNHLLGKFDLTGIPLAKRGVPQIEVTFEIDVNGLLRVQAVERGTGRSEKITIEKDAGRLSKEEVERMVREAEKFKEEDDQVRQRVEARNELEMFAYNLKDQISSKDKLGSKISKEDKKKIERAITKTLDWINSNESAGKTECDKQKEKLEEVSTPIINKIYENDEKKTERKGQKKKDEENEDDEAEVKDEL